jgi:hypothetical protein
MSKLLSEGGVLCQWQTANSLKGLCVVQFGRKTQFSFNQIVFGMKIAQQSISCGDNCTPQ